MKLRLISDLAPAKVNVTLRVIGQRDDGYHLLDSVVVFTDFGDRLSVLPGHWSDDFLTFGGAFGTVLANASTTDNLVLNALRGFRQKLVPLPPMQLHLEKNLPIAAGLGGGSSDAAACLRLLARYSDVSLEDSRLYNLAADLGADVPVCLYRRSARLLGIGNEIEDLPKWPNLGIVLINSGQRLATPAVFRSRDNVFRSMNPGARMIATPADAAAFVNAEGNDLQAAAIRLVPEIENALSLAARAPRTIAYGMSGSGTTCFALFTDSTAAHHQAIQWQNTQPSWWIRSGQTCCV